MMRERYDVVVIGGGPAGLAAAQTAASEGARTALLERDRALGGILNQCIHNGFGLHQFGEELTGPEYAQRFIDRLAATNTKVFTDTTVLSLTPEKIVTALCPERGIMELEAGAVVLAMGCRERTAGAISLCGSRPAGIFTAGTAQRYLNMEGYLVGREAVILGSGDIGLIMARRMTLAGAKVKACIEVMPFSGGLTRNIVQCLDDYGIPLYLSHTVTQVQGKGRVSAVTVAKVDEARRPIPGTEFEISCDTLLLSVGLIPENELSRRAGLDLSPVTKGPLVSQEMETELPGIFACGNVLHVHDLADFVTEEGIRAGQAAARFAREGNHGNHRTRPVLAQGAVTYTVPARITEPAGKTQFLFRVGKKMDRALVTVRCGETVLAARKRTWLAPGEMEQIEADLTGLSQDDPVVICAVEE